MKKKILYLTTIILTIIVTVIITLTFVENHFHSRIGMITNIDTEADIITVTCGNGNTFEFYGEQEDWFIGDLCSMIFYDNGTEIVKDDKIVSMRYGGYLELFEEIESTIK